MSILTGDNPFQDQLSKIEELRAKINYEDNEISEEQEIFIDLYHLEVKNLAKILERSLDDSL